MNQKINMMKNFNLLFILLVIFGIYGCTPEDDPKPDNSEEPDPTGLVIPDNFTKKVVVEEFTGEWCAACPGSQQKLLDIQAQTPEVLVIGLHTSDFLETEQTSDLRNKFLGHIASGYPKAAVDRTPDGTGNQSDFVVMNSVNWAANCDIRLGRIVDCGIELSSTLDNGNADIIVRVGYNQAINADTRLTVYIIENDVESMNQIGADSDYKHQHVLRATLTDPAFGDVIDMRETVSTYFDIEFADVDVSAWVQEKLHVIAIISSVGTTAIDHETINAQITQLGGDQAWD